MFQFFKLWFCLTTHTQMSELEHQERTLPRFFVLQFEKSFCGDAFCGIFIISLFFRFLGGCFLEHRGFREWLLALLCGKESASESEECDSFPEIFFTNWAFRRLDFALLGGKRSGFESEDSLSELRELCCCFSWEKNLLELILEKFIPNRCTCLFNNRIFDNILQVFPLFFFVLLLQLSSNSVCYSSDFLFSSIKWFVWKPPFLFQSSSDNSVCQQNFGICSTQENYFHTTKIFPLQKEGGVEQRVVLALSCMDLVRSTSRKFKRKQNSIVTFSSECFQLHDLQRFCKLLTLSFW